MNRLNEKNIVTHSYEKLCHLSKTEQLEYRNILNGDGIDY